MKENSETKDFKENILPNFEYFLRFALLLAKNGRDAARLMRGSHGGSLSIMG